jgi:cell division septal protein FtsQ
MEMKTDSENQKDFFSGRRRDSRWFRFGVFSGSFLLLGLLIIGAVYFLFYSDFLKVKSIEITGTRMIDNDVVLRTATQFLAGENHTLNILGPDNIIFWEFSRKPPIIPVLLPQAVSLDFNVDFWGRKVKVTVVERKLAGIWCPVNGGCFGFDMNGIPFSSVPAAEGVLVLKIDDQNNQAVILGRRLLPQAAWIDNIFNTLLIVRKNGITATMLKIRELSLREWEVSTSFGAALYFSFNFVPDNLDSVLKNLNKKFEVTKLNYLDFRVPNRIYYK